MKELETTLEEIKQLVTFDRDPDGNLVVVKVDCDVQGNVCGIVQGNVYGHVRGNVVGNVQGTVFGNVQGNVQGNVWGNVMGDVQGTVWGCGLMRRKEE